MADIINLRRARKAKKRADDAKSAAVNRVQFGRGKAEKQAKASEEARQEAALDGHALDPEDPDEAKEP